ncbi:MAG: DUF4159 domain-containing protein [Rhodospirillales bacterium]|nr:DUF4159 domain-containing protein [Rhodospirillales bacterium]
MSFTGAFGTLAFLNPWILAGLIFLPALWFLLRVTPPAPKLVVFPAARFVAGLIPDEQTASKTPWWILLLRLLILALIILALAGPVLNPAQSLPGSAPVRIIMDNSWPAAQTWTIQQEEAQRLVNSAGRDRREIYILTTAPEPGADAPASHGPLTLGQAEALLRGMRPLPWPADYDAANTLIKESPAKQSLQSYWLAHGLKEGGSALIETLQNQGELTYIRPEDARLPVLLRPDPKISTDFSVLISAPKDLPAGTPVTVNAIGSDGRILDSQKIMLDVSEKSATVTFDIPDALRNQVHQIRLGDRQGAGAALLLDDQFKRRTVGLATSTGNDDDAPLIEESYYIEKALEPYANIISGAAGQLIEQNPAVIILPNVGAMPPAELNALEDWVRAGGLLLRFAGPNMTQGENFLVPVPLLKGGRAMDGALTWDKPVQLAPFPETSPLFGLEIPEEVTVRRQLLAEPVQGLEQKSWALLNDGTPLITADNVDKGLVVLIHTTATPLWSDLALSGVFVQMLRRIVNLSGNTHLQADQKGGMLQPLTVLDGMGNVTQPDSAVKPIASSAFDTLVPGPHNPPGIYGRSAFQKSLNLGDRIDGLKIFTGLPLGVAKGTYGGEHETKLMPWLLCAALALFLCDWLLMAFMQLNWRRFRHAPAALALLCVLSMPAAAQDADYAGNIHLAYIKTGNSAVDLTAQRGLEALADVLARRTSVEPSGVVALDPERSDLAFFPLIYWPIAQEQAAPSSKALQNIQYYIDHGGTVLIDTRDQLSSARNPYGMTGGRNAEKLRMLVGNLNIPPLTPVKEDHVLTKSFYLLDSFPGRYDGGTLWAEEQSASGRDGVSSVIIGGNDWAAAWAAASGNGPRLNGGPQQQEMALRFGVNMMMYALTGNYKADQVHLPHILERLGQ